MDRDTLLRRIKETAYLEGDFVLRSGKRSNYYLDKYLFETQPDILTAVARRLAEFVSTKTNRIAGAELGGVPLAAATAMAANKPYVIIRNAKKDYGTQKMFEGVMESGETILLLEDVVTSGGQVLEAAKTIADAGCTVERIVAVLDREDGGAERIRTAGHAFDALFTAADLGVK